MSSIQELDHLNKYSTLESRCLKPSGTYTASGGGFPLSSSLQSAACNGLTNSAGDSNRSTTGDLPPLQPRGILPAPLALKLNPKMPATLSKTIVLEPNRCAQKRANATQL